MVLNAIKVTAALNMFYLTHDGLKTKQILSAVSYDIDMYVIQAPVSTCFRDVHMSAPHSTSDNVGKAYDYCVFIARQHAYVCQARYCYGISVRPSLRLSVTLWYCIEMTSHIVKLFPPSGRGTTLLFCALPPLQNFKGNSLSGALNTPGRENFAIFDRNRSLSRRRYEIGPWLLWNTNRKPWAAGRSMSFPMTLSDLERREVRGQNLLADFHITPKRFDLATKLGVVTHMGSSMFLDVSHAPLPRGGPNRTQNF